MAGNGPGPSGRAKYALIWSPFAPVIDTVSASKPSYISVRYMSGLLFMLHFGSGFGLLYSQSMRVQRKILLSQLDVSLCSIIRSGDTHEGTYCAPGQDQRFVLVTAPRGQCGNGDFPS